MLNQEFAIIIDSMFLIALSATAFWVFFSISGYGGAVGNSFKIIGWGAILMGLSHLLEMLVFYFIGPGSYYISLPYRILAAIGFLVIAYGFRQLIKK